MHLVSCLYAASLLTLSWAEDVMLEDFDTLSPADLPARVAVAGDNLRVSLVRTDERAGVQNLLITADLDPANPNWNHVRLQFPRRIRNAEALTFWYRGDKVARLYLIVEDSRGVRTDVTIGADRPPNQWQQANIRLKDMHVPNAQPPNDKATLQDVAALEVFPYPAGYPAKGTYTFQLDDISVARPEPTVSDTPLSGLVTPVRNGDLEALTADGKGFADWSFSISREAKATLVVSRDVKHGGESAALFHNESPVSPHVYSRFLQRVSVQPGTHYKLSCWVKGKGVRDGSHFTDWKVYTLRIPGGDYDWRHVETTLTTAPDQTVLEVGFNCVNVTDSLWIDDIELATDLTIVEAAAIRGARLALWCPDSVAVDREELAVQLCWQGFPEGEGKLRVEVQQEGKPVAAVERPWAGKSGALELSLSPRVEGAVREAQVVVSVTNAEGKIVATASREADLVSAAYARNRLGGVRAQLAELEVAIQRWEDNKLPLDYPLVTKTVAENFIPWVEEDIQHGEITRALQQIDELDGILVAAITQAQQPPPLPALTVPRYQTGSIAIDGGHFVADVKWPDGRMERRPTFFNGYGHFGAVRRDCAKFPDYGLNILQIEFGPNSTVMEDMKMDLGTCNDVARFLDFAAQCNVAVNVLLSPHYFPGWALDKWPELRGVSGGFNSFDIDHPKAREIEEAFLRAVVPVLRGHPALHSFCLSNEPIYINAPTSEYNKRKWHEWLQKKHETIARLNEAHGTDYESFDDVPVENGDDPRPRAAFYDWVSFNNERFAGWHRWMADIIHEIAPEIPVHAKIMNLPFARHTLGWGNDVELFCDLSQISGNDNFNAYNHDEGDMWANGWQGWAQFMDLQRSMRGQPSFNSENHVVADRNWAPVPGMHIRNVIWQAAIHGQGASTMWVWERTYDNKSDFAGSVMHRPAFCDAHGRAALDLMRLAPEVVKLQDAPARVAVVYSICGSIWNPNHMGDIAGIYQALAFSGEKVDFITYRQLIAGKGEQYPVIIVPGVTAFEEAGFRALAELSHKPGHRVVLIRDDCLSRDEYGKERDLSALNAVKMDMYDGPDARRRLPEATGLDFPVRVVDSLTNEPAWGVEWRWARDGDRWLVNLVNHTRKPQRVHVRVPGGGTVTNLFTGRDAGPVIELGMMEPMLVAVGG